MISASEARKKTDENRVESIRREIEQLILRAVSNGKNKTTYGSVIPECIITELEENGYIVSNNMIKW